MKIFPYQMNRKSYALTILLAILGMILLIAIGGVLFGPEVSVVVDLAAVGLVFLTMLLSSLERLTDIGKSKLWVIGIYVPLVNWYVVPMLLAYPPNAKENGLDKKAYFIFIVFLLLVIALNLAGVVLDSADTRPRL